MPPKGLSERRKRDRWQAVIVALCSVALAFSWQFLRVHFFYADNWTSLFATGKLMPVPETLRLREHIYQVPNSVGYDGQAYHLIAHDPLFRLGYGKYLDLPRVRQRRILVPGLAALFSFGNSDWVDRAYYSVILGFIFLGTFWLARWCTSHGHHPFWGLTFLITPAALISIPLLVIDVSLAALTVGFIWFAEQKSAAGVFTTLSLAGLARETGFLLIAGWCLLLLVQRQFLRAVVYAAAAVPALAWVLFVHVHTRSDNFTYLYLTPFLGIIRYFHHPAPYKSVAMTLWLATLDRTALAGLSLAIIFAFRNAIQRKFWQPATFVAVAFATLAIFLSGGDVLPEVSSFGRIFTPLLLIIAMSGVVARNWWELLPILMVIPRLGAIYVAQAGRILQITFHGS